MNVVEIFRSVQGESSFQGLPARFVRLAGCNLACTYCDTAYARDRSAGEELSVDEILRRVATLGSGHICVTGGEPLLQDGIQELVDRLLTRYGTVLVETNGSVDIGGLPSQAIRIVDVKCPASLESHTFHLPNLEQLCPDDELKFVIKDRDDYGWARAFIETHELRGRSKILMGPAFGSLPPSELAEWILEDGLDVRFNLQIHKYIWAPDRRGV